MNSLAGQHELSLIRKASRVEVPVEMIRTRKKLAEARADDAEKKLEWFKELMQGKKSA